MFEETQFLPDSLLEDLQCLKPAPTAISPEQLFYQAGWDAAMAQYGPIGMKRVQMYRATLVSLGIVGAIVAMFLIPKLTRFLERNDETTWKGDVALVRPLEAPALKRNGESETDQAFLANAKRQLDPIESVLASKTPLAWRRLSLSLASKTKESTPLSQHKSPSDEISLPRNPSRSEWMRELTQ